MTQITQFIKIYFFILKKIKNQDEKLIISSEKIFKLDFIKFVT